MEGRADLPIRFLEYILPTPTAQHKLKLQNKFVEEYGHELSDAVRLTDRIGEIWFVSLEKVEETLWLHHGWEKFFVDHSIQYGYFLLFEYRGNSIFNVYIFDLTSTEIHYPPKASRNFEETSYCPENSFPRREEHSNYNNVTIPDSFPTNLVVCSRRSRAPNGSRVKARHDENQSSRGIERDLRKKAIHSAGTSSIAYPSFTVKMKENLTPQWVVYVPASFARKYLPRYPELIELYDSDGKIWLVHVNIREDYADERDRGMVRALSTGWAAFAKAKKIEVGDTCVFELIQANEPALKVSIFYSTGEALELTDETSCSE